MTPRYDQDRRESCCDFAARAEPDLYGGTEGIMVRVSKLEKVVYTWRGGIGLVKWIGAGVLLQLAGLIWLGITVAKR
jgi:hypothetical protein